MFNCFLFEELYGPGHAEVLAKLPGSDIKYPVNVIQNGIIVTWNVSSADVGKAGYGELELRWMVDETLAKSQLYKTHIRSSMTGTDSSDPPDPYKDWVDTIVTVGAQAKVDAQSARSDAEAAHTDAQRAEEAAQRSELYANTFVYNQMTASDMWTIAHNLGKHPSVTVVDSAGSVVLGETQYVDENTIKLHFLGAFSGSAYLN